MGGDSGNPLASPRHVLDMEKALRQLTLMAWIILP